MMTIQKEEKQTLEQAKAKILEWVSQWTPENGLELKNDMREFAKNCIVPYSDLIKEVQAKVRNKAKPFPKSSGFITTERAAEIGAEIAGIPNERIILMGKFTPKPFADKILSQYHFKFDRFKRFWMYDDGSGLWEEDGDMFIAKLLRNNLFGDEQQKNNYVSEVVGYIRDMSWTRQIPETLNQNLVAFNNCIADLATGEIKQFSPSFFINSKVMINLDEKIKECPKIDAFFTELLGDKKSILYDMIAYCFYRGYPYQKMFILHGGGENGKTTYLDLVTYILGEQNIASETPQELATKDFSKGLLWRKFANISSELPYTSLTNTNTIKGLCGGDLIKCNRKFKEPFQFKNSAKLIFAGNELPVVTDKTHAWARRLYIIQFEKKISKPIRDFLKGIISPEELSGLAWVCFNRLMEMKARGWQFEIDVDAEKMMELYEDLSNPLMKFIKENLEESPEGYVFKYEFKATFEGWCKSKGFRIWNETELGKFMKAIYPDGRKVVWVGDESRQYFAWLGIKWKHTT
jgi:P4 family phage/plasmid primase-like protien